MASKSKSRRRVFRASCILAALIVAGSSFAWFTSKDEVTNRLSASGDYDVTIAEDFTPPENWLPGQKVDKNVGAVNTGTIDAFVRMWLEGEMTVLNEKRDTQTWSTDKFTTSAGKDTLMNTDVYTSADGKIAHGGSSTLTKETDQDLIDKNLTYYYMDDDTKKDSKISLKELDNTNLYLNPNSPITEVSSPDGYTEVMALQAGGELVYVNATDDKFTFIFTPNQTNTIVSAGYTDSENKEIGGTRYDILGGQEYTVYVKDATVTAEHTDDIVVNNTEHKIFVDSLDNFYKYLGGNIDTNTFEPCTTGLYIFKRNTELNDNEYADSEYTGYYYVATASDTGANGKFFALQYENDGSTRSNYVLDKDTYTIVRDNTGKETFVPSNSTAEVDNKTFYKIGNNYYDANGFELVDDPDDANDDYSKAAALTVTWSDVKAVTLYTAKKDVIKNTELTWKYQEQSGEGADPTENSQITYGGKLYTYNDSSEWTYDNGGGSATAVTDSELAGKITEAYKKANAAIEVEDNGKVYTYKDGAEGAGWYEAGSNTKEGADSEARLNAAINKHATLTATYYGAENDAFIKGTGTNDDRSDDISVVVNLNNVNGSVAEAWTRIINAGTRSATASTPAVGQTPAVAGTSDDWGYINSEQNTFYYNNDVEEGASTKKLVDSVELSKDTQKNAYLGFDFDLNVNMESMQITIDDNGTESGENIKPWASTTNAVDATGTVANADPSSTTEISSITWNA